MGSQQVSQSDGDVMTTVTVSISVFISISFNVSINLKWKLHHPSAWWASCRRGEGDLTTAVGSQQVSQSDGDVMTTVTVSISVFISISFNVSINLKWKLHTHRLYSKWISVVFLSATASITLPTSSWPSRMAFFLDAELTTTPTVTVSISVFISISFNESINLNANSTTPSVGGRLVVGGEGDLTTAVGSQQVSQSDGDVMTTVTVSISVFISISFNVSINLKWKLHHPSALVGVLSVGGRAT